jgi:hypothetical protein
MELYCKGRICMTCGRCRDWDPCSNGEKNVYIKRKNATCIGYYFYRDHSYYDYQDHHYPFHRSRLGSSDFMGPLCMCKNSHD